MIEITQYNRIMDMKHERKEIEFYDVGVFLYVSVIFVEIIIKKKIYLLFSISFVFILMVIKMTFVL